MNQHEIRILAEKHGLFINSNTLTVDESGVDFKVVFTKDINDEKWLLRIPRRKESMRSAEREKKALDLLGNYVSFEVPNWSIFSDELIAYKLLKDEPVATIDLDNYSYNWIFDEKNLPSEYENSLGKVLAELHALPHTPFKEIGLKSLSPDELRGSMKRRMDKVKEGYEVNPALWERWQAWIADDSYWPGHVGLRHGDLHPAHIMVNKNYNVTGLIDWSEIEIADISNDFLSHYLLFGSSGLDRLIAAYDNAGGRTWPKMNEHITELCATNPITVAEYAEVSGLEEMKKTAQEMLASEN